MIVYAVVDDALSSDFPLGVDLEVSVRREDAERFIEEVRGHDPELASYLRIEETELEAGWLNSPHNEECPRASYPPHVRICASCGGNNAPDARFCSACGHALPSPSPVREERKVVSVLFCDLVDFTSHVERLDPEEVRAIQAPYYERARDELERHGGTVEKFIGDAVMALFGAPVAHEDDPERAVRAALAIRDWAAEQEELRIRIAITTGEALVRLDAEPLSGEGMASGDVVNTAARLQATAPENGVVVDAATHNATEDVVEYREAKSVQAKGKAEPVLVWEAVRALAPIRPARGPGGLFVGREHELAVLKGAFVSAVADSSTQLVTLVGVPGIGKSRLVHELFNAIESDGSSVTWLEGRSLPYGAGVTLWALGEVVKTHAGILESDGSQEADEKLRRAVSDALGETRDVEWVHAHLRPLVVPSSDGEPGGDRRAEAFAAWRRFLEALAAQRPLILVLEDVHWADDTLLDFVEYLVEWATELPLLMLATARPELLDRRPAWTGSMPSARTLVLAQLSDQEATELLAALLDRALLDTEAQATLLTHAAGNPLYAEEYVRLLATREGDAEPGTAPETVQGIIAARIDGLSIEEKGLLQDAAVIGRVFWSGAVGVLAGRDRWAVEERLLALERRELLRRERRSTVEGETQYGFNHELMRDVAYGGIPHGERADKHLRAADWIEALGRSDDHAELLAHHYLSALEYAPGDGEADAALAKQARLALRDAGDRAFSLNAFGQAAGLFRDALGLWPADDDARPQLLFRCGSALQATGDAEQGPTLEDAFEALLTAGDIEIAAEAAALLATMWWNRGDRAGTEQHLDRAVGLVHDRVASTSKAHVLGAVSRFRMLADENEEAIQVGNEALAIADALHMDELRANLNITIGSARWNGGDTDGLADLERGLEIALEHNAVLAVERGYNNLAMVMGDKGEQRRRQELLEAAERLAERLGDAHAVRSYRAQLIGEKVSRGQWDEALYMADELIAECEAGSPHGHEPWMRMSRAEIRLARDDVDGAVADLEKALALARHARIPNTLVPALVLGVRTFLELGRTDQAVALADEVLSYDPAVVARWGWGLVWYAEHLDRTLELEPVIHQVVAGLPWRRVTELVVAGELSRAADIVAEMEGSVFEAHARLLAARRLSSRAVTRRRTSSSRGRLPSTARSARPDSSARPRRCSQGSGYTPDWRLTSSGQVWWLTVRSAIVRPDGEEQLNARTRTAAIVVSLAAAIALGAGVGAGTYAVLSKDKLSIASIYDRTHEGVVEITTTMTTRPPLAQEHQHAQGSGWVYNNQGDIVTNEHVVADADTLSVRFWNSAVYPATVVGRDRSKDLAVIKVDAPSSLLHALTVGNSDALHVGDEVVTIGSPFGLEETVTSGIVSALDRAMPTQRPGVHVPDAIQTDAAINGGSSGSPLLNAQGKLVGVNASIQSESGGNVGVNFAIPSSTVASVVDRLISNATPS